MRERWLQGGDAEAVEAALTRAVADMVAKGLLPEAAYPAPHVRPPSTQQRNSLGSSVVLTSPCALPAAAAARRASGAARPAFSNITFTNYRGTCVISLHMYADVATNLLEW